jgi:hypothetical protein
VKNRTPAFPTVSTIAVAAILSVAFVVLLACPLDDEGASSEANGGSPEKAVEVTPGDVAIPLLARIPDFRPNDLYDLEDDGTIVPMHYFNFDLVSKGEDPYAKKLYEARKDYVEQTVTAKLGIEHDFVTPTDAMVVIETTIFDYFTILQGGFDEEAITAKLEENGFEKKAYEEHPYWVGEDGSVTFFDEGLAVAGSGWLKDFWMAQVGHAGTVCEKYPRFLRIVQQLDADTTEADLTIDDERPPHCTAVEKNEGVYDFVEYSYISHVNDVVRESEEYREDDASDFEFDYESLAFNNAGTLLMARFHDADVSKAR